MAKQLIPAIAVMLFLSSCSALKSLNFSNNRQPATTAASSSSKFIDDISITPENAVVKTESKPVPKVSPVTHDRNTEEVVVMPAVKEEPRSPVTTNPITSFVNERSGDVESANAVQLKYAVLLNTEVEYLPSKALLETVDDWYGVRYRTGGNTKSGVDCSGFTVAVYAALYGFALPRVSKEQYRISRKISITELQEGDLVFFHTTGSGVSHVGVYLGNNRFIHASVSRGVMVSGLFEPYYVQRFVGAGRIDDKQIVSSN